MYCHLIDTVIFEFLGLSNLGELRVAVYSLTSKWHNLGIGFGISTSKLEEFRSKYRGDPDRCLTCILAEWIRNCNPKYAPPTWKKLVIVVASRVGGDNPKLAREIAMKQCMYHTDILHSIYLFIIIITDDHRNAQEWINSVDDRPIGELIM
jgi:hypothetical protein